jgi:two-component system, NarL family, response regulator NreC
VLSTDQRRREAALAKIRVLIADDHTIVRRGVRLILEWQPDIEVIGEASDGEEAVQLATRLRPDVVLMDVAMPRLSGIEATRRIHAAAPAIQILGLTMHEDEEYFYRLLQAGGAGYIVKGANPEDLLTGVRTVAAKKIYLCPEVARAVLVDFQRRKAQREEESCERLATRERAVLRLIGEGQMALN